MGPTASGKTDLAEALADRLDAALLNADAFQVYRGLDIGTAKPAQRERYRLLDLVEPSEPFGLGEWVRLAQTELEALHAQGRSAVVVGGTGLYLRALCEEYDALHPTPPPELREALATLESEGGLPALLARLAELPPEAGAGVDLRNPQRVRRAIEKALGGPPIPVRTPYAKRLKFGLCVERRNLSQRIEERTATMLKDGWVDEVATLRARGFRPDDPGFRAIGYRHVWSYLEGVWGLSETLDRTVTETLQYAKRQETWLRKEPNLIPLPQGSAKERLESAIRRIFVLNEEV